MNQVNNGFNDFFAIAQYKPGHLRRMKDIDEALADWPGLVLTGSSYRGISVNYCAKEAEAAAAQILDHLAALPAATGGGV